MTNQRRFTEKLAADPGARLKILMASLTAPVSTPTFYEKALRKFHDVFTFGPHRDPAFWQTHGEGFKQHAFYRPGSAQHWADVCSRLAKPCDVITPQGIVDLRGFRNKLPEGFEPDLFIWIDQQGWNIPVNLDAVDCPRIAIFGDTHMYIHQPQHWPVWLKYARTYDYVFLTFNKPHIRHFQEAGCRKVFWLPAACDPEAHGKISAEKIYNASFVGGTRHDIHHDRIKLLELLKSHGVDVYIDSKVLQDMALVFSRSKIVLNKSMADDLNMRVFEAMASGSLLLTNRLSREAGLEELFTDKRHLVLYDDTKLLDLIRYYLEHDEERERIAAAGYSEVLQKHTYEHRVREIIRIVQKDSAGD